MRSILFSILFLSVSWTVFAQREVPENLQMFEDKPYQFGFSIGAVFPNLQLMQSGEVTPFGTILVGDVKEYKVGLNVCVLATLRLTNHLDLRASPGVTLVSTAIQFSTLSNDKYTPITNPIVSVPATYIEFPLVLKYRAARYQNAAPYLIAGGSIRQNSAPYSGKPVALTGLDGTLIFGAGCDFYLPYFRFGVELKINIGLNNVMKNQRPDLLPNELYYTHAIDKAFSRMFILSFNFE